MDEAVVCRCCGVVLTEANWYESLAKRVNYICKQCILKESSRRNRDCREKIISHYSGGDMCCCFCGSKDNLHVDHRYGNGNKHRREIWGKREGKGTASLYCWLNKNGWPSIFRILCSSCNYLAAGRVLHSHITRLHQSIDSGLYEDIRRLREHSYGAPDSITDNSPVEIK